MTAAEVKAARSVAGRSERYSKKIKKPAAAAITSEELQSEQQEAR
jgi:hypothetical protein